MCTRFFVIAILVLAVSSAAFAGEGKVGSRKDVSVTVYNRDLGLVRETRRLDLPGGSTRVRVEGVASKIDPTSVSVEVLSGLRDLVLLEQNYEFDLLSPSKLMEKYVGKRIELVTAHPETGVERSLEATLLSMNEGPVYRIGEKIYLGHPGRVVLPEIPGNLMARPTLVWLLEGSKGGGEVEVSYLTRGFSWKADYVALLDEDDGEMDLTAWVTLTNTSGASYWNARLKLVAGDVHRAAERQPAPRARGDMVSAMALKTGIEEEPFFEYHLYSLPRRTDLRENQTKQIELLSADGVGIVKEYVLPGSRQKNFNKPSYVKPDREHPLVVLRFRNVEENGLGVALPAGIFRFYKEDSEGMLQLVGEDSIDHTPKGEEVHLEAGKVFDITAERSITDYQVIKKNKEWEYESTVTLRNAKEEKVTVKVYDVVNGEWEVIESTHEPRIESATSLFFEIPIAAGGESVLEYRIRIRNH
jgi:hypothetical protein